LPVTSTPRVTVTLAPWATVVAEKLLVWSEDYKPGDWQEDEWLKRADQSNLDVMIARQDKKLAAYDLEIRRSGYFPELTFKASVSTKYHEDESVTQGEDARMSLGLHVPLFQGGNTVSSVRQGRASMQQAEENLRAALEKAMVTIHATLDTLESGKQSINAWRVVLDARAKTLEAAEESRRLGFKDMVDVLDAQTRLNRTLREDLPSPRLA